MVLTSPLKTSPDRERATLRLVIVGHVDHGKSTLIGRLLYDTESLPPEKMEEIRRISEQLGHEVEFAYIMDHLEEERRDEMTIDTAQAFFKTAKRDYVIIDAPGHRELLKNMITGAAQAQAAILVVDAAEGLREQTQRHAYFLSLLGVRQVAVLVNKMDKVGFDQARFDELAAGTRRFLASVGISEVRCIPGAARLGDNIVRPSANMTWHNGMTILAALDEFSIPAIQDKGSLRFPIQDIYAINGRKILAGRVESGRIEAGQDVLFLPSRQKGKVRSVEAFGETRDAATAGECVGVTLDNDLPLRRGEVACPAEGFPVPAKKLRAHIFWMAPAPCARGEKLLLRIATQEVPCVVAQIDRRTDSSTLQTIEENADRLLETEVGRTLLAAEHPIVADPFADIPEMGRIILTRDGHVVAGGLVAEICP